MGDDILNVRNATRLLVSFVSEGEGGWGCCVERTISGCGFTATSFFILDRCLKSRSCRYDSVVIFGNVLVF